MKKNKNITKNINKNIKKYKKKKIENMSKDLGFIKNDDINKKISSIEDLELFEQKKSKILEFIKSSFYRPMKISDIINVMEVPESEFNFFVLCMEDLINSAKIVKTKKKKIILAEKLNIFTGTYTSNPKGFGFVILDDDDSKALLKNINKNNKDNKDVKEDIFIPKDYANGAMHKDRVICQVINLNNNNNNNNRANTDKKRYEGSIVRVIEKGYNIIVGTYEESSNFGFVIPDDRKLYSHIYIPKKQSLGAVSGHKVTVKITKPSIDNKKPEGNIVEILGHINDPGVDILSIIKKHELPIDFEDEIYTQIESISSEVLEDEKVGRLDLRNIQTVTIDGSDAKDLDDAITIRVLENNNYELGVHIADVTHYVKEGTSLDREAIKRGTSVYLVDRVIPMLPHKLSNGICSLNQGVDRLALSCIMEIDETGDVVKHNIAETLIKIDKRMTYDAVADILKNINNNNNNINISNNIEFLEMFKNMESLRNILRNRRTKRGSIDFDFPEIKVILDENRTPIDLKLYERNIATSIIEEFMLIANETVAEAYFWLELPFVYRSHAEPDVEKIEKMSDFISKFGYNIKLNNKDGINSSSIHSKQLQKVLKDSKGTSEELLISTVMLRSFKQARYTSNNEGHFGLSAKYYCHFTSPIRRYPDLQIHRIIKANLNNNLNQNKISSLKKKMPDIASKCSIRERVAEEAERETITLKKIEYMLDKIGQNFHGIISGVTSWGIYVKLPNTIEGMVLPKSIEDDNYIYDEANLCYTGTNTLNKYCLGDKVLVKLVNASKRDLTIDFKII